MSTAAISGFGGKVKFGNTTLTEVRNWKGSYGVDTADVTALSSSGYRHRISTIKDFTGTFETNVYANPQPGVSTSAVFYVGATSSATKPKIACKVFLKMSIDVPVDAVNFTYDFESAGPVTITAS